uniref:Uncharacterized protein n=1 Tax=Globodera rostochiensis TaxID=31243 RepID=A0A914HNF2_GLORO
MIREDQLLVCGEIAIWNAVRIEMQTKGIEDSCLFLNCLNGDRIHSMGLYCRLWRYNFAARDQLLFVNGEITIWKDTLLGGRRTMPSNGKKRVQRRIDFDMISSYPTLNVHALNIPNAFK